MDDTCATTTKASAAVTVNAVYTGCVYRASPAAGGHARELHDGMANSAEFEYQHCFPQARHDHGGVLGFLQALEDQGTRAFVYRLRALLSCRARNIMSNCVLNSV